MLYAGGLFNGEEGCLEVAGGVLNKSRDSRLLEDAKGLLNRVRRFTKVEGEECSWRRHSGSGRNGKSS
jgi:hypothetical protein